MITFTLPDGSWITVRASGTEPKIKYYIELKSAPCESEKCRPVGVTGAEQLLLDTHALKTFLLSMPSAESSINTKPPTVYTNVVVKTMTKAEMVLKIFVHRIAYLMDFQFYRDLAGIEKQLSELEQAVVDHLLEPKLNGLIARS
ncbi:unnamed protein product [Gongylonema pulchrum]|uniref:PGM_PMM_IV domain-containing protein n=1 Tax=Gongylonema pulchrum TaxID=637853 RepID=A0A183E3E0_9BILA|nr:unnamed protein product [Gongylonema pulchrum]